MFKTIRNGPRAVHSVPLWTPLMQAACRLQINTTHTTVWEHDWR